MTDSQRAVFNTFLRDSFGFDVVTRGETTSVVALTPRADSLSQGVAAIIGGISGAVTVLVVILAVIYLPIPIALTVMTAAWLWQRRSRTIGATDV